MVVRGRTGVKEGVGMRMPSPPIIFLLLHAICFFASETNESVIVDGSARDGLGAPPRFLVSFLLAGCGISRPPRFLSPSSSQGPDGLPRTSLLLLLFVVAV